MNDSALYVTASRTKPEKALRAVGRTACTTAPRSSAAASLLPRLAEGVPVFPALREAVHANVYRQAPRSFYDTIVYDEAPIPEYGEHAMSKFPVVEIRSVELGSPNLAKSEYFYIKAWGLQLQDRVDGVVYLRASGRDHHVLSLRAYPASEVVSVRFRTATFDDLQRLSESIQSAGGTLLQPLEHNSAPDGGSVVTLRTPEGYILRFIHGDTLHTDGATRMSFPLASRT